MPRRPAERREVTTPPDPSALLPLSEQVFQVLLSLVDEDRHGYGIMRDIAERTGGAIQLGAGTLYGSLKRLLSAGLIEELDERPDPGLDDERRRYYRLTPFGAAVARCEARRLSALVQEAQRKRLLAASPRTKPA